jgi:DNA-binding MarR family transcriptional regulator
MSTVRDHETGRQLATRDLLRSLMAVRGWFRDSNRWVYPRHSNASLAVLASIGEREPVRISDLAETIRVDVSVVSRQVQGLDQDGLVERRCDPNDGRAQLISLSDEGRRVFTEGRARLESRVAEQLGEWEPEELAAFALTLRRLLDDLTD